MFSTVSLKYLRSFIQKIKMSATFCTFLGSNGFLPTEDAHTSCYMIPELGIVFDAGSGFFRVPKLIKTPYLDVFISHGHLDHMMGIQAVMNIVRNPSIEKVTVHAEQPVIDQIKQLCAQPYFPIPIEIQLIPFKSLPEDYQGEPEIIECSHPGVKITYFPLKHTSPCYGFRVDYNQKSIAYVTDTISTVESPYLTYLNDLEVLFHEVYSLDPVNSMNFGHTDALSLAQVCNKIQCQKLVLIHHNPAGGKNEIFDFIKKEFPDIVLANDNESVQIFTD